MRKHIIGLALFSFIVSAAAIVYGTFNNYIGEYPKTYPSIKTVRGDVRREITEGEINSPVITQAIYSIKTGKFSWTLSSKNSDYPAVLNWFVSDEKGIRMIDGFYAHELSGSEKIELSPELISILRNHSSETNLYIIADTLSPELFSDKINRSVEFDSNKAIPVTIDYGK